MKTTSYSGRHWLPAAILMAAVSTQAGFVQNPSFESNYPETWPHYGTIDLWNGGSGVNLDEGPFHNTGTPIPDGTHVGFRQGSGDLSQEVTGLEPGKQYWIQFFYDARNCCGGSIDLITKVDGLELDKIANVKPSTGGDPYKLRTVPFTAESDFATLTFSAVASGDATVAMDAVNVVQRDSGNVIVANPSFEASGDPELGLLAPAPLAGWVAEGQYGVDSAEFGVVADNGTVPDQDHVLFLQDASAVRQSVRVVAGKPYQLSLAYNARSGNSPQIQVKADGTVLFEEDVAPVGGSNAYRTKTVSFTSKDVTAQIEILQTKAGDQVLLVDDVRLTGEVPSAVDPLSLSPEVVELGIGEQVEITVKVPADVLAVKDVDVVLQSTATGAIRFLDPSGAMLPRAELHFAKGGGNEQSAKIQALARGSGNIQVIEAGGVPVKNQIAATVVASALKNPSFDSTPAPADPGYGAIPGWTGGSGFNAAGQAFADNGIIPDRKQVAFLQGTQTLSQEVRGLIPGKNYWLQFFYNLRDCCPPGEAKMDLAVNLGGKELARLTGITAVGEGAPYHFHHAEFVAENPNALLEFKPTPSGDATLLLDGVTIVQRDPGQVVVRNPSFEASGSVFVFPGYFEAMAGWEVSGGNRGVNIDGVGPFTDNGRARAGDLVLFLQSNGSSASQNLTGLVDGRNYLVGFLVNARSCCGPEDSSYSVSFQDVPLLEEVLQPVGGANAYLVKQATFTAFGTEGVLRFQGTTPEGDHTLLFDNIVVMPESGSAPFVLAQPASAVAAADSTVTLSVAAVGSGNLTYQWKKDGQPIPGQTEPVLLLENITPAEAGDYTVEIRNGSGSTSSAAASVKVLEPIAGLYDTGVGNDGIVLADGATDLHYKLVQNADDPQSSTAFVQDSTVWPIADGTWLLNNEFSVWIGPRVNPGTADPISGPAGGDYVYGIDLDLTGYDPASVLLSGLWAADNSVELLVNGLNTGVSGTGFAQLAPFSISGVFKSGVNQLDFRVNNGDATGGPTGLRVEELRAVGAKGEVEPPASPALAVSVSAQTLRVAWPASATGFVLQSTGSLSAPWTDDPATVSTQGNDNSVSINISGSARFYRLIRR